jgi:hypothetical protein
MMACMKYLIVTFLACITTLYAEKVVNTQIEDDTTHHVELVFPNDWEVELDNHDLEELNIYDNISPCKLFVKAMKKPSLLEMPTQVWIQEKEKIISSLFSYFEAEVKNTCQPIQFEGKVVYQKISPVIYQKSIRYFCNQDQTFSLALNFVETEEYILMFALALFDPTAEQDLHARIQAFANCIHIVPNKVLIR